MWRNLTMKTHYRPDIAVMSEYNGMTAWVEITPQTNTTAEWAGQVRDAVLGEDARYMFVVVARDHMYFWSKSAWQNPPAVFETEDLLGPILSAAGATLERSGDEALTLAMAEWLVRFNLHPRHPSIGPYGSPKLMELRRAVADARVEIEPVAA